MPRLKRWLRDFSRRHGWEIARVTERTDLSAFVASLCHDKRINCVIDVGANIGQFARELRIDGYRGHIFSFEPVSHAYAQLERNSARDAAWLTFHHALGSADAELPINVLALDRLSSFLGPSAFGSQFFGKRFEVVRTETVPLKRLDAIFDELVSRVDEPRVFLKIDTQGWDMEVLKGASGCIDRVEGILTEAALEFSYDGMTPMQDVVRHLEGLGFDLSAIFTVTRSEHRLVEADVVMVRRT